MPFTAVNNNVTTIIITQIIQLIESHNLTIIGVEGECKTQTDELEQFCTNNCGQK